MPGSAARSSPTASRIRVSGLSENPAPTPIQSRSGGRPRSRIFSAISSGVWRSSASTATPRSMPGTAAAKEAIVSSPLADGVVVGPHRGVAEHRAARRERLGDGLLEARGDAEPALAHAFSSSATHSMCGVWGNMSTGRTRRSLYPASTSWAALGASVVGLHDT